jgi:hypothetical protein
MDVVDNIVTASNYDPASGGQGKPRSYQKLLKVELVEEPAAQPAKN